MCYKFKAVMMDGSEMESRIKTSQKESYRDAWIKASRLVSEMGEIRELILLEVER